MSARTPTSRGLLQVTRFYSDKEGGGSRFAYVNPAHIAAVHPGPYAGRWTVCLVGGFYLETDASGAEAIVADAIARGAA